MTKTVLHLGWVPRPAQLHPIFRGAEWREVRLDVDPTADPVLASITDLSVIADGSMDGLFSAHNLEHLYAHEIGQALAEFRRVLGPDGVALLRVPDLQRVAERIAQDQLEEPLYTSAAGAITPLDVLFGLRSALARGETHLAPRTGFTATTLAHALVAAGFETVRVKRDRFDLWALAYRRHQPAPRALEDAHDA